LFLLVALLLAPSATALAEEGPLQGDTVALPAEAGTARDLEPTGMKEAPIGVESTLAQLQAAYQVGDATQPAALGGNPHVDLADGTARVILEMAVDPEARPIGKAITEAVALASGRRAYIEHGPQIMVRAELTDAIAATGATYETAYENRVQVLAPIESIAALAEIPGVRAVRLPYPATTTELPAALEAPQTGSRTSEGVALTGTNLWNSAGYTGAGVNAAIYDWGFTGWQAVQASGDLPTGGNLVLKDFSSQYSFSPDTSGYEHGTACAEVVSDMAPGSRLYLYAFSTDVELGNAINDYRNNVGGKRVATMSVGYVNAGPYDGTGQINTMVSDAQSSGILWINSSGNQQRSHWSGTSTQYASGNTIAFGSGNIQGLGPDPGSLWNISSGTIISVFVEWNDWNGGRTGNQNHIDYDLFLVRWTGSTWIAVASSLENQCSGTARPTEKILYQVPLGGPYNYGVVLQRDTGGGSCPNNFGHWMQMHSFLNAGNQNVFWYANQCNSVMIPADGDSALAVGATFWNQDGTPPLYGLEYFSSLGPRNAFGGANPGSAVNKPDVVAPDGVSTVTYGASNGTTTGDGFFGTSASAPHVAGISAVVWSRFPAYNQAQVRSYVQANTVKRGDGGACGGTLADPTNNRYGFGRINLPDLPSSSHQLYLTLIMRG
jgi:hypothetical protein